MAQAQGCAPIADALLSGAEQIKPYERPSTVAESLAIGKPSEGNVALREVRRTGGSGVAASDDAIIEAMGLLARLEGVFAEPAGATPLAAAITLAERGEIAPSDRVVIAITGNGFKSLQLAGTVSGGDGSSPLGDASVREAFVRWDQT